MRSLLKKLKSPWDERKKLISTGLACAAGLIVALVLPLAFRASTGEKKPERTLTLEEKAILFAAWWYDDSEVEIEVTHIEPEENDAAGFCAERMEALTARCINDRGFRMEGPSGEEYVNIEGETGTLRLCRMWLEASGDWQNWLDVCFDADTGLVYYLYLSRECLSNQNLYTLEAAERPTAESVAGGLARESGGELRRFLDDGAGGGAALITCDGGSICYTVGCVYYDALIDIRVGVV